MIAFVLSGGGNRGALQAGALKALLEHNIHPDLIVATSVGALNGVTFAARPTVEHAQQMAEGWCHMRRADIFPGNALTAAWRILRGGGSMHSQKRLAHFIVCQLPANVRRFKDLKVPCIVTSTSLDSGQLRLFGSDPSERLLDALLASTAIPPFFAPYAYQGERLVDGAVVANLPIAQAIMRGARTIYALEIVDELTAGAGPGLLNTLASSLNAMLIRQREQERQITALGHLRGVTIHEIKLTAGQNLVYNDFSRGAALVAAGEHTTLDYLRALPMPQPSPLARLLPLVYAKLLAPLLVRAAPTAVEASHPPQGA